MLSVIVIHVTSTFIYAQSDFSIAGMNPAFILNQVTRFAVPLFILLSGLSLGFSRSGTSWLSFLKGRCIKILVPYIVWTLIYWLLHYRGNPVGHLANALLRGSAAPHLYFIVILIQLYLLYPLLKRLVSRHPVPLLIGALFLSLLSQQVVQCAGRGLIPQFRLFQFLWELFPSWIFYFVLGMVIAHFGLEKLCTWCGRYLWTLLAVTFLYALWFVYEAYLTQALDTFKLSMFFFAPLVLLTALAVGQRLRGCARLSRLVSFLAARSQTVFFSHVLVLEILRRIPFLVTGMRGMAALLLVEILLSVAAAWCIDILIAKGTGLVRKQ